MASQTEVRVLMALQDHTTEEFDIACMEALGGVQAWQWWLETVVTW